MTADSIQSQSSTNKILPDTNNIPPKEPQESGLIGRAKSAVSNIATQLFGNMGQGFGAGFAGTVTRELESIVQPNSQIQKCVEQTLFNPLPDELFRLKELLKKSCEDADALTKEEVQLISKYLKTLSDNQQELLRQLDPDLRPERLQLFQEIINLFQEEENDYDDYKEDILNPLKTKIKEEASQQNLQNFATLFNTILEKNKNAGIVNRAAKIFIDKVDDRLTSQAHPLLSDSRKKLIALRKAIICKDKAVIQEVSKELEQLLKELTSQQASSIFKKKELSDKDRDLINQLKKQLPDFYSETPLDQNNLSNMLTPVFKVIDGYCKSQEGTAATTAKILANTFTEALDAQFDRVEDLLGRLENVPKKMASNLLGATESSVDGENSVDTDNSGTVSQFLDTCGSILKNILSKGAQAASKQTLAGFATILSFGIGEALNNMEDTEALYQPKQALRAIIEKLGTLKEGGNWLEFCHTLNELSKTLRPVKIYINGFLRVPTGNSAEKIGNAEEVYCDNMNALQKAINSPPAKEPISQDWKRLAKAEKDKFVENMTKFLTIKHIYEDVCQLKPRDAHFYTQLLMKSKETGIKTSDDTLKELFFKELVESKVGFITAICAKIQYFFYSYIVNTYVTKASTIYFDEIFDYIKQHKAENFDTLRNQITTNSTRYLTILGSAYENVAQNPQSTGTLSEMLKMELEKKESNLGFGTKDLYSEFAKIVIHKTVGTGLLGWIVAKLIGNPEKIVRSIFDKSLESMQDVRGYTHALNSVIREELEDVWKQLQADYAKQQNHSTIMTAELSDLKKNELGELIKNLFEVLNKSKCQTKDELRDLIQGNLLSAKINNAVDDLFIKEVIEKVTNILALTIQFHVREDQLEKFTYKFASLVNRTFEVGKEITLQQMQAEENRITTLSEQILRLSVNTVVEEKFDLTGKKQQNETNSFISDLQNHSKEFFATTGQDLDALSKMDLGSSEVKKKINKITGQTFAYEQECYQSSFQAKSSKLNSDNRDEIGERYLGIAQESQPVVQAVAQLKKHFKTLENVQTAVPILKQINETITSIPLRLFHSTKLTNENLLSCENQLAALEAHLVELKKICDLAPFAEQITTEIRTLSTILLDLRKVAQVESFHKDKYYRSCQRVTTTIKATRLLEQDQEEIAKKQVKESIAVAQEQLQILASWEQQHIQQVPYVNLSIGDMKSWQDWTSKLIYNRIKERFNGFRIFLKREETYRYGILNHLFLLPYIQSMKGKK